jgi:hypothetical protein
MKGFWALIEQVERALHSVRRGSVRGEGTAAYARFFAENSDLHSLLRHELRLQSLAFGLCNQATGEFNLLEGPQFAAEERLAGYPIFDYPFFDPSEPGDRPPGPGDSRDDLIQWMFLGGRARQKLNSAAPEFYAHILEEEAIREVAPSVLESRFIPPQHEQKLRQDVAFPFLYATTGEIAYFVTAWRLLARFFQCFGRDAELRPDWGPLPEGRAPADLWSKRLFAHEKFQETPENHWFGLIDEKTRGLGPGGQPSAFGPAIALWDSELRARFDRLTCTTPDDVCFEEWGRMGLFDSPQYPLVLAELFEFWDHLIRSESERNGVDPGPAQAEAERAIRSLRASEFPTAVAWRADNGAAARALWAWTAAWLAAMVRRLRGESPTSHQSLRMLHKTSRVPILPFYYLSVLGRLVPEQIVFPVYHSFEFQAEIRVTEQGGFLKNPYVVVALLTRLAPPGPRGRLNARQMGRLRTLLRLLAEPVVDAGFFGRIIRQQAEREGQKDLLYDFAHEHFPTFQTLYNHLADSKLIDTLDPSAVGNLLLLRATLRRFLAQPQATERRQESESDYLLKLTDPWKVYLESAATRAWVRARNPRRASKICRRAANKLTLQKDASRGLLEQVSPIIRLTSGENPGRFTGEADPRQGPPVELDWKKPIIPSGSANLLSVIQTEPFGILFILALGQALYHSFRILHERPGDFAKPLIQLNVGSTQKIITIEIRNPGPSPQGTRKPNDVANLAGWADVFNLPPEFVEGPEYRQDARGGPGWVTRFSLDIDAPLPAGQGTGLDR